MLSSNQVCLLPFQRMVMSLALSLLVGSLLMVLQAGCASRLDALCM